MASSDFDLSNPNVFKTDVSFDVKYEEVEGVKKNPRIDIPKFTLGGIEFQFNAVDVPLSPKFPFDLTMKVTEESLQTLDDDWVIECQVASSDHHIRKLDPEHTTCEVLSFKPKDHFDLVVTMDFKRTQLYRFPFVDAEEAKKNRSDCKIILEEDTTKPIYVNKHLLAMHSEFFQKLFFGDFQEKDQEEVKLSDVTEEDFLQYLFCVQPPIKPFVVKNFEALFRLADRFENLVMLASLEKFLLMHWLTPDEKRQTLIWAERYQMPTLFHETLNDMLPEELAGFDGTATAHFKENYMKAFHDRLFGVLRVALDDGA